jgi:hypothetical protein
MRCDACYPLLKSWSDALNEYAFRVSELKYSDLRHYERFYDEATAALELAIEARARYDEHREEHAIGIGLENSKQSPIQDATARY